MADVNIGGVSLDPKQLLIDIMSKLWSGVGTSDYVYLIVAAVAIVLVVKVLKWGFKNVWKVAIVAVILYILKKYVGL